MALTSQQFPQTAQVLSQFVEAVIHSILFHRNVYPGTSFEDTQLYGMIVHYNRHPQVADYVKAVAAKATSGGHVLAELRVVVYHELEHPAEHNPDTQDALDNDESIEETYRLTFSPTPFSYDDPAEKDDKSEKNARAAEKLKWYRMHDDFRATLLRIEVLCKSRVVPTDPQLLSRRTFRVQLVTTSCSTEKIHGDIEDIGWMVVERPAAPAVARRATPVHTVQLADGVDLSIRME